MAKKAIVKFSTALVGKARDIVLASQKANYVFLKEKLGTGSISVIRDVMKALVKRKVIVQVGNAYEVIMTPDGTPKAPTKTPSKRRKIRRKRASKAVAVAVSAANAPNGAGKTFTDAEKISKVKGIVKVADKSSKPMWQAILADMELLVAKRKMLEAL